MTRDLDPAHLDCRGKKTESWEDAAWRAHGSYLGDGGTAWGEGELTSRQEEAEETCLSGKRRAGGVGAGHQRASAQELEKEQWPAEGPRASSY